MTVRNRQHLYSAGGEAGPTLQRYTLADATEGGASGILNGAASYDSATGTFTIPIADGAADYTIATGVRWWWWLLTDALGDAVQMEGEDLHFSLVKSVGALPAELFVFLAYLNNEFDSATGGIAGGFGGDGLGFFAPLPTATWGAPTTGATPDTSIRAARPYTAQRLSTASGVTGVQVYQANLDPAAASSIPANGSSNLFTNGVWTHLAIGIGRKAILASPTTATLRIANFVLKPADIPGATAFLA